MPALAQDQGRRSPSADHRKCPRRRVVRAAALTWSQKGTPDSCIMVDVSESGAGLIVHRMYTPGTPVELTMLLDATSVRGRIVWCDGARAGIAFDA